MRRPQALDRRQQGFTMIELIMVIVIMGVIGGIAAVFIKGPIDAYFATGRRAALTDVADTVARRIARDLHRALPNSVRTSGTTCLEFIPVKTGGRYRAEGSGALVFNATVTSFNMLGDYTSYAGASLPLEQKIASGDKIVVYNLGTPGADAYSGDNIATVTSVGAVAGAETPINISSSNSPTFRLPSASQRFHVVASEEAMVSYVCSGGNLYRTASNVITASASCQTTGPKIATRVDCTSTTFSLADAGNALSRNALVAMRLAVSDSSLTETVNLHQQVHVDNTP